MRFNKNTRLLVALLIASFSIMLAGCKDDGPSSKVYVRQARATRPLKIAVLSFTNLAPRSDEAAQVVTNAVVTYLLSTGAFDVVEPGLLDQVMSEQRIRPGPSGLDSKSIGQLRDALGIDAILTGTVEDYGEVRVGNDTYPSVSFSARLISAKDGSIVWAGMVSKTGADKVLLFDFGRISSMGKLVKVAVATMAAAMKHDQARIVATLGANATPVAVSTSAQSSAPIATAPVTVATTPAAATSTTTPPAVTSTAAASGASKDESKTYSEDTLKALLPDLPGFTKKDIEYSKHYHDTLSLKYQIGDSSLFVDVGLVDYQKAAQTQKFMQTDHAGETIGDFNGLPAFTKTSEFKYMHIDIAVGRFGLFVSGPEAKKTEVEKVATTVSQALL